MTKSERGVYLARFQKFVDSLHRIHVEEATIKLHKFNIDVIVEEIPNYFTAYNIIHNQVDEPTRIILYGVTIYFEEIK